MQPWAGGVSFRDATLKGSARSSSVFSQPDSCAYSAAVPGLAHSLSQCPLLLASTSSSAVVCRGQGEQRYARGTQGVGG